MTYLSSDKTKYYGILNLTRRLSMPRKSPYIINLSKEDTDKLKAIAKKYTSPYRDVIRAKIILYAAQGLDQAVYASRKTGHGK